MYHRASLPDRELLLLFAVLQLNQWQKLSTSLSNVDQGGCLGLQCCQEKWLFFASFAVSTP